MCYHHPAEESFCWLQFLDVKEFKASEIHREGQRKHMCENLPAFLGIHCELLFGCLCFLKQVLLVSGCTGLLFRPGWAVTHKNMHHQSLTPLNV